MNERERMGMTFFQSFSHCSCSSSGAVAKVVKWYKEEGSLVKRNDVLCDIETEVSKRDELQLVLMASCWYQLILS